MNQFKFLAGQAIARAQVHAIRAPALVPVLVPNEHSTGSFGAQGASETTHAGVFERKRHERVHKQSASDTLPDYQMPGLE